ncbi:hypothetical protein HY971_03165 [Candidatus Kaiserbacteria bacterium]|nr:hypothetical protein [Candidatus Kaiserbacteria bacterium]
MAETNQTKPPPLHERSDVFEDIAAQYNGGNNLQTVQDEFRGACKLLKGTAVPKEHEAFAKSIVVSADLIGLGNEADVQAALTWVASEQKRNAEPKKSYTVEDVWPPKKPDEVGGSPPMDDSGIGNSKAEVLPIA